MFKKLFIPHDENDYKPHILRETAVIGFLVLIFGLFIAFAVLVPIINRTKLGAAIITSVIVDSTNQDRGNNDLGTLTVNPLLVEAAQAKANDMATRGYFAHNTPDGLTPWYWFKQAGYNYLYAGENLAVDFTDSEDVENAWMNSPTHRANILNGHFTDIGVATARGMLNGKETTFVVQEFGSQKPADSEPVAVSLPVPTVAAVEPTSSAIFPITVPQTVQTHEITSPTNTFVAVKRVEGDSDVDITPVEPPTLVADSTYEANWFEKIIVNPSKSLLYSYIVLGLIILIALVFLISAERKADHRKHLGFGIFLLIIMLVLLSMHWILTLSGAVII